MSHGGKYFGPFLGSQNENYLSTSVYCSSLAIYLSPHELTEPTCHIIGIGADCFSPIYYTLHTVGVISNSNCSAV